MFVHYRQIMKASSSMFVILYTIYISHLLRAVMRFWRLYTIYMTGPDCLFTYANCYQNNGYWNLTSLDHILVKLYDES